MKKKTTDNAAQEMGLLDKMHKTLRNLFAPEIMVGAEHKAPVPLNRKQKRTLASIQRRNRK